MYDNVATTSPDAAVWVLVDADEDAMVGDDDPTDIRTSTSAAVRTRR
jgi:hypothetical protein